MTRRRTMLMVLALVGLVVAQPDRASAQASILDTLAATGEFQTLLAAIGAAGLEPALEGPGPLTVFAPTDDAFAKLPPGTMLVLMRPDHRTQLNAILGLHVVPGRVTSGDLAGKAVRLDTAAGTQLMVDGTRAPANVGGAALIGADIEASNGVIHVVDRVILPPS